MKVESVIKINLDGSYKSLYMGNDRGEARRIYKDNMLKKDEFLSLFQCSGYSARTMSKAGFTAHNDAKKEPVKKKSATKKKKKSED